MPRLFIPITSTREDRISITGEKAKYLISVLRCRKGDELIVFDGRGNCLKTNILNADRREVIVEILEKFACDTESPINIILVQGLLKGKKMDTVIQKATELGVKKIIPITTDRSQPRETRKGAHWMKIAEEASRQCGRNVIPTIHEPMYFNDWVLSLTYGTPKGFIFYEEGGVKISEAVVGLKLSLKESVTDSRTNNPPSSSRCESTPTFSERINPPTPPSNKGGLGGITEKRGEGGFFVIIGPEGGFTKGEVAIAEEKGFIVTSLGRRILRAETAAISAITLVQFLLGDLG